MENITNIGGQLVGVSAPQLVQSFFTLLFAGIAMRLMMNAVSAFRSARKDNPVFSRAEVCTYIEAQMASIQNILEDGGIPWTEEVHFQWLLYLCRKIRVRHRIILVEGRRYEAAGFTNADEFWRKADLRLGASPDVAKRAEDGTPIWTKTETSDLAREVLADAKLLVQNKKRRMSLPTEVHRFRKNG